MRGTVRGSLAKVIAISNVNQRRAVGDRRVLFVAAALPIMLILVIGFVSGRNVKAPLGVVMLDKGPIAARLVTLLDSSPAVSVRLESDIEDENDDVLRGKLLGALVIPADFDSRVRSGLPAVLKMSGRAGQSGALQTQVAVAGAYNLLTGEWATARYVASSDDSSSDPPTASVESAFQRVAASSNTTYKAALSKFASGQPGPYSYTTPANLVLFVFLTALVTSSGIVESRKMGLFRRMLASPTSPALVVTGQLMSSAFLGLSQGVGLLILGELVFGVRWGDPLGVLLVVVIVSIAAAGASLLLGTFARSVEQAIALGTVAGVAFGMLGGCMWTLDSVGPLMRTIGHIAPQAWAMDAFVRLVFGHSGIVGILPDVGVLALFALGLVALATYRLRTVTLSESTPA